MARGMVLGRGAGRARQPGSSHAGRRPSRPRGVDPPLHRPRRRRGPRRRRRRPGGAPGGAGRTLLRWRRDRRGRRAGGCPGPRLRRCVLPRQRRVRRSPDRRQLPAHPGRRRHRAHGGAPDHRSRPGHGLLLRRVPGPGRRGRHRPAGPPAGGHLRPARDRRGVARPAVDLRAVLPRQRHPPAPPGRDVRALRRGRHPGRRPLTLHVGDDRRGRRDRARDARAAAAPAP